MTPYYQSGGITIYHGDCREILPGLGAFDLALTDPPYGIRIGTRARPRLAPDATRRWGACEYPPVIGDDKPFDPAHLLELAPGAVLWGANNYASRLPDTRFWLAWDRKCGRAARSNITDCELAAVYGHRFKTVRMFRHMWAGFQRDSEVGQKHVHPTQKPVALMAWCLDFFPDARRVVDPYMGSGPVAKACLDAGREYVGIELDERYCEVAVRRLEEGLRRAG